jgi:hypothetical protein
MERIIASRRILLSLVAACALGMGCSSTTTGNDATTDAGSEAAAIDVAVDTSDATFTDAPPALDNFLPTDAPQQDAPPAGDGGFPCGTMQCNSATEYCQVLRGRDPDGGVIDSYRCDSFEIACPTEHTCACLQRSLKCSTSCTMDNGGVTSICGN